jgi:hypothetical protein
MDEIHHRHPMSPQSSTDCDAPIIVTYGNDSSYVLLSIFVGPVHATEHCYTVNNTSVFGWIVIQESQDHRVALSTKDFQGNNPLTTSTVDDYL